MLMFAASNAVAKGGGGHGGGGGFGGGGFHGGGWSGGGWSGGGHVFSGNSGGNMSRFSTGSASPRFSTGGATSFSRFQNDGVARMPQGEWRHTQSWNDWGRGQAWYRGRDFDHDRFEHGFVFAPFFSPGWYDWYGWPGYNDYGYYSDWPSYYYGDVNGPIGTSVTYAAPEEATNEQGSTSEGESFAEQAREAFVNGNYREALRLAGHAGVETPRDAAVHELMSLSLFALKDYRGAALEAHAALSLGPPIDWPTLFAYYGNVETYTKQLRALETYVKDNPKSARGPLPLGLSVHHDGQPGRGKR